MDGWREGEREIGGEIGGGEERAFFWSRRREREKRREEEKEIFKKLQLSFFSLPFAYEHTPHKPSQKQKNKKPVEDVLNVVEKCRPDGIIVQFGGQTPLKLATPLAEYLKANPIPAASGDGNVRIWGTQPESIDAAEDRDLWYELLRKLDIKQPPGTMVSSEEAALKAADDLGYPVMVRRGFSLRVAFFFFFFGSFYFIFFCFSFCLFFSALDARGFCFLREGERKRHEGNKKKLTFFSLGEKNAPPQKKKKKRSAPPSSSEGAPWRSSTPTRTCRATSGTPSRSTRTSPCWWTR